MYYDSYAQAQPTGFGRYLNERLNLKLAKRLLTGKPAGSPLKIGEVGYGRGLFAAAVRALHADGRIDYYAIEPNHAMALLAGQTCVAVSEQPLPPFPQENGWTGFDHIVMSHVIEHFPHFDTIITILHQAAAALKDDGSIMFFFPDYLDYHDDFFSVDHSHEYILTRRRMLMLLEDAGLEPVVQQSYRACLTFPLSTLIYPFHRVIRGVAGLLWDISGRNIFFKLRITFARNILIIAKKRKTPDQPCSL